MLGARNNDFPYDFLKGLSSKWDPLSEQNVPKFFEGVCVNCRHPAPRHGEPRVCSAARGLFPVDQLDPLDLEENSCQGLGLGLPTTGRAAQHRLGSPPQAGQLSTGRAACLGWGLGYGWK